MQRIFVRNLSYLTLIQVSNTLIPLLIIPILARTIDQDNFGKLEFARYFCFFFSIIVNYGFDVTVTRDIANSKHNHSYLENLICQTFFAKTMLLLFATTVFLTVINLIPSYGEMMQLLALTFLINLGFVLFPLWYYQGVEKLSKISIINFFIKIAVAVLTVLLIRSNSDYYIFNFLQSIALIALGILSLYFLSKEKFNFRRPDFSIIKQLYKSAFPVFLSTILVAINGSIFFIIIENQSSVAELGAFSTSNKIVASLQAMILLPFSQAFFPMVAQQANQNLTQFRKSIYMSAGILFFITAILALLLNFYADVIVKLIFGYSYLDSTPSLKILSVLPMLMILTNIFAYQGLLSLKKDRLFLFIHTAAAVFCIISCFVFAGSMNAVTGAIIRIAVEGFLLLLAFFYFIKSK